MTRLVLIALALTLFFNLSASQMLWVETCAASACGTSCMNCSNATMINNTNSTDALVLCPQSGTFCFIDTYFDNGTWGVQNCSSCAGTANTSCSGCTNMNNSFSQDFCSTNGTCWSIQFNNSNSGNNSNTSKTVNISISSNSTSVNGTNTTTTTVTTSTCNCTNATTGVVGTTGVNGKGQFCTCPLVTANTTSNPNGTVTTTVTSPRFNESISVAAFGSTLPVFVAVVTAILATALLM